LVEKHVGLTDPSGLFLDIADRLLRSSLRSQHVRAEIEHRLETFPYGSFCLSSPGRREEIEVFRSCAIIVDNETAEASPLTAITARCNHGGEDGCARVRSASIR